MPKRMRLPNGFGQISKIKGRRLRHPFRAMVTIGWDLDGKPKRMTVGYYENYNDAYSALLEYHKDPYTPEKEITLKELYEMWSEYHFKRIKEQSRRPYITAWSRCEMFYDSPVKDIKVPHIKMLVDQDMPPTAKNNMKNLLNNMLDYALQYDIVEKNYSRLAMLDKIEHKTKHHEPYSEDELNIMWKHINDPIVRLVLIQCYTGLRPNELLRLNTTNINTDEWYFVTGSKTEAGMNRVIPVHKRIRNLITEKQVSGSYDETLRYGIPDMCKALNIRQHRPHDGRTTFITRMKNSNANEYAIKRIVGHSIADMTEDVYTKRSIEWLHEEVAKIV